MKFVRWLGAFGAGNSLHEAAAWETRQCERQVAAEPLVRGKSLLSHAKIGLGIAHPEATFARGWLEDAWTEPDKNGILKASRERRHEFKDMNRFLAALSKRSRNNKHHAEAAFNCPAYDCVVVKHDATPRGMRRAKRLAKTLNLPLRVL